MDLDLELQIVKLPACDDKNVYAVHLFWRNPPGSKRGLRAPKTVLSSGIPSQEEVVKVSTEALMDMLALHYGDDGPREMQRWWCIYRCHRHYIGRTIVDTVKNANYTDL